MDNPEGIIELIERVIGTLWFQEVFAGFIIVTISAAGTEFFKRGIRQHTKLADNWTPRAVALVLGLVLTPVIWPDESSFNPWVMGLFLTLIAPMAYPVVMKRLRTVYRIH